MQKPIKKVEISRVHLKFYNKLKGWKVQLVIITLERKTKSSGKNIFLTMRECVTNNGRRVLKNAEVLE